MKKQSVEGLNYIQMIFVVCITVMLCMAAALYYSLSSMQKNLDTNIQNTAALISSDPITLDTLRKQQPTAELTQHLNTFLNNSRNIDIIVVCNAKSIRLYHSDNSKIGEVFVGGDEGAALKGAPPYISQRMGSLGTQRGAFVSIREKDGSILGFVMVSVLTKSISALRREILLTFFAISIGALALGCIAAWLFNRNLRSKLMGFAPEEFSRIFVEREEVMDALEEGVVAINADGKIIMVNRSAKMILDFPPDTQVEGIPLVDLYSETNLPRVMREGQPEYNVQIAIKDKIILSNRIPIKDKDQVIGAVSIFRNKTEVTKLAEALTGANTMVDTMRAFNHEFSNKLHVLLGLIQMGKNQEASALILNSGLVSTRAVSEVSKKIALPNVAALIIGKILRANELGITLRLQEESLCIANDILPADAYITIIGNLLENAIEQLNSSDFPVKEIDLGVFATEEYSIIAVDDTGGGIAPNIRKHVFEKGVTTKGKDRGVGLALVNETIERYHGEIVLDSEVGVGTSITISFG